MASLRPVAAAQQLPPHVDQHVADLLEQLVRLLEPARGAAIEDSMSRIWGGVHFPFSITDGFPVGQNVGDVALASFHNSV